MNMNAEILAYLRELQENNNREWFHANKARFDALREGFLEQVQTLIHRIALFDPELVGVEAKDCFFRIYRDIRFSPNKTPYKIHFAAYMAQGGRASDRAGYYIHLEPGDCLLSGGVWCPPPPLLKKLRQDIYDHADEFTAILENPTFKSTYPLLEGEMLKRMPAGYPADSPYGYILKHKDFSVASSRSETFFNESDWMERAVESYRLLLPFNRFLNETVDEYQGRI